MRRARASSREQTRRRPSAFGERALMVVATLFTIGGAWLTWRGGPDRRTGIGLLAFFGLCLGVFVWTGAHRASARRSAAARDVQIAGGVWHRVRVGKLVAMTGGVGATLLVVSWSIWGSPVAWLSVVAGLGCLSLAPVVAFGPQGRRAVAFEPTGLRLAEPRFEVVFPWDDIAGARVLDVHDTSLVGLALRDPAALVAVPRRCTAEQARLALATFVARSRAWTGTDVALAPSTLGLDPVLFVKAVETYVSRRDARAGLGPRAPLPGT